MAVTFNVGLRIFHSNKKNINYFLYRKEYLDYAETLLAKVGKNGRSVKSIGSKVMLKTKLYRNDSVATEKTIKNGISMLPAEFKIFHSNKDDQTYLLMKDRVGQLRFYRKTAENQYEFLSSKKSVNKGVSIEKKYKDGSVAVVPKRYSTGNKFSFSDKKSVLSGMVVTGHLDLYKITEIEGNLESLRKRFANNYHLKKLLNSVKNTHTPKDSFVNILKFFVDI